MIKVAVPGGRGPGKTDFTEQELHLKNSLIWRGERLSLLLCSGPKLSFTMVSTSPCLRASALVPLEDQLP